MAASAAGRFITFDGGEGAGKTTQIARLAQALRARGHEVVQTREPGGAPGADLLRAMLLEGRYHWPSLAEILLHFASRADHVESVIRPALARGAVVLCDRFADSTMVYQGFGLGGDRARIAELSSMIGLVPDLTLVLDVSVATTQARLAARGQAADRYESLGEAFFARIRDGFLAVARDNPDRCVVLSGERAPDAVTEAIASVIAARLPGLA